VSLAAEDLAILHPYQRDGAAARKAWRAIASPKQIPPPGDWDTLLWLAGRFFGKTRCLSEHAWYEALRVPGIRVHAIAPTVGDVRRVLFEGAQSGLLACMPPSLLLDYNRSVHEITMVNGSKIIGFSATEEADRLRGPECHMLIFDECAAADRPPGNLAMAYKVAALGCRLKYPDGTPSRKLLATTPRPIPFLRQLIRRPNTVVVRGTSHENLRNVADSVRNEILTLEGTSFGKQEIYGQILDDAEHAIFRRDWIKLWPPFKPLPEFNYILMSLDTAMEEEDRHYDRSKRQTKVDYSACTVFGVFNIAEAFTEPERKRMNLKSKYGALLCDFWMERLGFPELLEKTRTSYRLKYGEKGKARKPDLVLIENKMSGISLRQTLIKYGVPTAPFDPMGQSKTMRGHVASPYVKQGMLWLPESMVESRKGQVRDWCEPLMEQLTEFAGEGTIEFDDGYDSTTQALIHLSRQEFFDVMPQDTRYPDLEERKADEEREAQRIAAREKKRGINPYAQ
jgi:phage terminase large subunit-like protein